MKFGKLTTITLALSLTAAFPAFSKDHGKGHGNKHDNSSESNASNAADKKDSTKPNSKLVISAKEREIIQVYVNSQASSGHGDKKHGGLPPGLAKKVERGGSLPPGWEKKVAVGQPMPPEVLKVAVPLPKEVVMKLPPSPVGTLTVAIDGKIVRLMEATKTILDVFDVPMPPLVKR